MISLAEQYDYNTKPGPDYRSLDQLPDLSKTKHPVRYIAFYLPQFHAIPENDQWWGKGFTEWTNVTKALPRFVGHYQPRLPGDLGFYDLSNPDHIRRQVELAKRAGIYGFCIHNYWHSGRRLLETPLNLILQNKDIDIRFCLNWANENWTRRWDGHDSEVLIQQNYAPGEDIRYAEYFTKIMTDERYITIDGRPLLMVYRPDQIPNAREKIERWREFAVKQGLPNPFIIFPQWDGDFDPRTYGLDAAACFPPHKVAYPNKNIRDYLRLLDSRRIGHVFWYDDVAARAISNVPSDFLLFPGVCPSWDNEARRPNYGMSFAGSSPAKYGKWLRAASEQAMKAPTEDQRIVFLNAWNEWAEGAYLEPDRHFGYAYLVETARVLQSFERGCAPVEPAVAPSGYSALEAPTESPFNYIPNRLFRAARRIADSFGSG